ncbi:MAG: ABC transporter ATP-binding protein, partial [Oscillospiraceae bacterium]|nr:ABC transporter ATP-binding protein [Oscillospiraceae bacterium]
NTSVLLMDEATAALDEITANGIMNSVLEMEDITRIIVTHRLDENILRKYDEIIVLHHGEVAEKGTFDSLIDKRGLFYSLFTVSK